MVKQSPFPAGKLPSDVLGALLENTSSHPRLIVGPQVGEDAAVIDMGDRYLVAKSDPITFVEHQIGRYAVHVNANDIACMGAVPLWFLMTLLLPEGRADEAMVGRIWQEVDDTCAELGINLCGGHTEITSGLEFPILSGHMLGEVSKENLIRGAGAQVDDFILLTRPIPVEGTAILADVKYDFLKNYIDVEMLENAKRYLESPGISVVAQALTAAGTGQVHAMHDPTEGGLATGIHEMAEAACLGAIVEEDSIPISLEGGKICEVLGLDPLGVITSGALLLAVPAEGEEIVREALMATGAIASRIGEFCASEFGVRMNSGGKTHPLKRFDSDEISRAL
ncbi:MAG: AIR synthase family protein [Nitrospinae bacterium]|nr:AIR synthase family protein [Nitrospinota bacterium]